MLTSLVKAEFDPMGIDSTEMAIALSDSDFHYRALTDTSEQFSWYRIPFSRVSAFTLPSEHIAKVELQGLMEWSATFRETIRWDQARNPEGWPLYTEHEKLQSLGIWFKKMLTALTVALLKVRLVWKL